MKLSTDKKDCIANAWRLVTNTNWPFIGEWKFDAERKWRFDWAHSEKLLATEIDGGTWTSGRHSRGKGIANDCEKYNAAAVAGWRVLRFTPQMVKRDPVGCVEIILAAAKAY